MKTNFHMIKELLEKYHPASRSVINTNERKMIKETLCIDRMNILQLRNLRDFTVLYMSKSDKMEDWDRMSAITYCIDSKIVELGGEV